MITYSTNWMGPVSLKWIENNGDCWAAGRIDVRGLPWDEYYEGQHEYSLPPMHKEDWGRFSEWLRHHKTTELHTFKDLINTYERTNPPIRWFQKERGN